MAIRGTLREASLPDVLQLLSMARKTGCLAVVRGERFGNLFLEDGRVASATVLDQPDRLGDLLVRQGEIERERVEKVLARGRRPGERIGQTLLRAGVLSRERLAGYLTRQLEEAVYDLCGWDEGEFHFTPGRRADPEAFRVSLDVETLLLEAARRIDEWSVIRQRIPSLDLVFRAARRPGATTRLELDARQKSALALVDGSRTAAEVIDELGPEELDGAKVLFELAQAGLIEPIARRGAVEATRSGADRAASHLNLGAALYRSGLAAEAERELERALELEPTQRDALFLAGRIALERGDGRAAGWRFRALAEAGGANGVALHGLALALERLGRYDQARTVMDAALRERDAGPQTRLSAAILATKAGRCEEASRRFAAYRADDTSGALPVAYYLFASLAEGACGRLPAARDLLEEGISRYPDSAVLLLHLGRLQERIGAWAAAEPLFRRAAEEDPLLPQAHKALGDARYRRGDLEGAAEAYTEAVRLAPGLGPQVYVRLGNIQYERGRPVPADAAWRKALELDPGNEVARSNLETAGIPTRLDAME